MFRVLIFCSTHCMFDTFSSDFPSFPFWLPKNRVLYVHYVRSAANSQFSVTYHIISLSIRQFNEVWKISGQKSIRQLLGKRPSKEIKTTALVLLFWVLGCWYLYLAPLGAGTCIGECGCWYLRRGHMGAGTYVGSARVLVLTSGERGCW